ncbi:hypothetical protein [Actinomadura sp. BRA 177]|uniref:hypothetical protein n=1 Tax=Actinomadura sp. BRA 177 TaxID=2745202 RepID=UPI0020CDEDC1|nr:hypothetical protein [Actinomadura sp. BRA 177]
MTGLANALSQNATQFGDPARVFTAPGRAAAVTGDAIKQMAGRWLAPGGRTALTYGGTS